MLEFAGFGIEVVHTPGHTPGSVAIHVPAVGAVATKKPTLTEMPAVAPRRATQPELAVDAVAQSYPVRGLVGHPRVAEARRPGCSQGIAQAGEEMGGGAAAARA